MMKALIVICVLVLGGLAVTAWHYNEQAKQQQRIEAEKREAERQKREEAKKREEAEKYDQLLDWLKKKKYWVEKLENEKGYKLSYNSFRESATDTSNAVKFFTDIYVRFNGRNLSIRSIDQYSGTNSRKIDMLSFEWTPRSNINDDLEIIKQMIEEK